MDAGCAGRAEPAPRGNPRLRRRLRLHADVGAALHPRPRRCGGGERCDERDVRRAPRRRVPVLRRPAEVRRRRAAPVLRRRRPRGARGDRCVPHARPAEADRTPDDAGRARFAAHARRHPQRAVRLLPRRLVAPRARRRRAGGHAHGRDGGPRRRRGDPAQRRSGGARLGAVARRGAGRGRPAAPRRSEGGRARGAAAGGEPGRPHGGRPAAGAGGRDRGHRRGRAPPRLHRVRPFRRHRRGHRPGSCLRRHRSGGRRSCGAGRGRPVRGLLPRIGHRRRRRSDRPRRRRAGGVGERRGADAPDAACRVRRAAAAPAPCRRQPGPRLRRRGRRAVPPHVHDPRRYGRARRAADGAGAARSDPGHGRRARALAHDLHGEAAAWFRPEGEVRGGRAARGRRHGGHAGRAAPARAARRPDARAGAPVGRARAGAASGRSSSSSATRASGSPGCSRSSARTRRG